MSDVVLYEQCNVDKVLAFRETLLDEFTRFEKLPVAGETTAEIVAVVAEVVGCEEDLAASAAVQLGGTVYTKSILDGVAWRAAGNYTRLQKLIPVRDWRIVQSAEWCAAAFLDAKPTRIGHSGRAQALVLRVVSGLAAGVRAEMKMSYPGWAYFSRNAGFKRKTKRKHGEYEDPSQYVGFFVEVLVPGATAPRDSFRPEQIRFHERFHRRNSELRKLRRQEVLSFKCQLVNPVDCHRCFIGRDRCEAAVHPKTYEIKSCGTCNNRSAHDAGSVECRNCQAEATYRGKV